MADTTLATLIDLALSEDRVGEDVTSALLPAGLRVEAAIAAREGLVVAGLGAARAVFARVDPAIAFEAGAADGDRVAAGAHVARVAGPARAVLSAERTALNFLCRLSGIATLTRRYLEAASGTAARIADTRKTTPGWRALEKAAVRAGGGDNHRMDLGEAVLIKDNHLAALGSVAEAVRAARARAPAGVAVEVEVDTLAQLDEALAAGAAAVLLDNFTDADVAEAVRRARGRALVEVSGGVALERVRRLANLGVERISVGRLTHSAPAADLALDVLSVA